MDLMILEIDSRLLTRDEIATVIGNDSLFFSHYDNNLLLIKRQDGGDFLDLPTSLNSLNIVDLVIDVKILNLIAKQRLINNFEKTHPELTLVLMDCGSNSKFIRIKRKK